jgi:hypothetical protein
MTTDTANTLMDHHKGCGGFEFTKSTLQRDEASGARYYRYCCLKCGTELREYAPEEASVQVPRKEAA